MVQNLHKILGGTGFGLLFFGLFGTWYLFPKIIDSQLHANIDLKEGTMGYDAWKKQPFPLKFKIYFFNVTNAADVQLGAKPMLRELGPYVYDEYRERIDVTLEKDKDAFNYILKKYYYFNKQESGHYDQDDVVTILNAALVGTALQVQMMLPTAMSMVNDAVPYLYPGVKDIFLTAKVRNILFDGIPIKCDHPSVDFICGAMKGALPKTIQVAPNGKDFVFSMFRHLNGTDDGPWEMERGMRKNTSRGEVISFEKNEILDIWEEGSYCNMINGSDSTVFEIPPKIPEQKIYSFSQDLCRSLYVQFENITEIFGMRALRYTSSPDPLNYDSGEFRCFCPFLEDDDGEEQQVCPMNGLGDLLPCVKAPVLFSYPHFYLGDPRLLKYASGLNPQKDLHEIYALLEPTTATPLSGAKRVQINIEVKPIDDFVLLENVTRGIFPIIWLDEGVTLPPDFVQIMKSNFRKLKIVNVMKVMMIIIGFGLGVAGGVLTLKKKGMFCFARSDSVEVTPIKPKNEGNKTGARSGGTVNPAFEGNAVSHPRGEAKSVNNNIRQPARNHGQQWNAQVWHSGQTNEN